VKITSVYAVKLFGPIKSLIRKKLTPENIEFIRYTSQLTLAYDGGL
jgi:hypothetical protein